MNVFQVLIRCCRGYFRLPGSRSIITLVTMLCAAQVLGQAASRNSQDTTPSQAAGVGYRLRTFTSSFVRDVDDTDSRKPGFNWYVSKWYGWAPTRAANIQYAPGKGVTLTSGGETSNFSISSASHTGRKFPSDWVGIAFGGGGYFEAYIRFEPTTVLRPGAIGFPAWWLWPLNAPREGQSQWKGQPLGFAHHTEVDIFEYSPALKGPTDSYLASVHEWYGLYGETCRRWCQIANYGGTSRFDNNVAHIPEGTDFRKFHKYGLLWVPATSRTDGYLQYYFDDQPVETRLSWSMYRDEPPPPGPNIPWAFGVLDRQEMFLVLGTGVGQPMTILWVNVWQHSSEKNVTQ